MSEGKVVFSRAGSVGRIVFDNQPALNALTFDMWRQLGDICREIAQDRSLRIVTLRGAGGKAFLAGTEISGFLNFTSGQDGLAYERQMDEYIGLVEALPMPTLAIVEGWAVGGGIALSFACDLRIATPSARFGSPIGRSIGNCLSTKGYVRMVNHVGVSQAKRMLLLGELLTAQELFELGHILKVVEPEELDAAATAICERVASHAPLTMSVSKEAIRRYAYAGAPDIDDLVEVIYGSEDFRMGVRNFLEKKPRVWTGA
ncbi:MAG: Enoyl-CoA hydratase [Phenylobacterium sp.]|jgi:enoyl-CoA hydratase|nr:Enoyl-CoA hydratase [Phenylobacterium sp.]